MEVQRKDPSCVDQAGCLLSFGLWRFFVKRAEKNIPVQVTDQEMIFEDGKTIRWQDINRAKITRVHVGAKGFYVGTVYDLKHTNGKIRFGTRSVVNEQEVVKFIESHLPAAAREQ